MNILRLRRKGKKIKVKRYLLLLFSLIMTTFAWFAYSKVLDTELNLHLITWDLKFIVNGEEKGNPMNIAIQELYPGMEDQVVDVIIQNNGEATSLMSYAISEISILGETYNMTNNENATLGNRDLYVPNPVVDDVSKTLTQTILNDSRIPFKMDIEMNTEVESKTEGHLKIKISWPSVDDELDTKWGYDIAQYYGDSASTPQPLRMSLKLDAIQKEEKIENEPADDEIENT